MYKRQEFSLLLGEYRAKKREYELMIRKEQKQTREQLRREHGVQLTPKFDIVVARSHPDFEKIQALEQLEVVDQDYMSVTFQLKPTDKIRNYISEVENINAEIESEEEKFRETPFSYTHLDVYNIQGLITAAIYILMNSESL